MSERPVDELEQLKSAFDELDSAYVDLLEQNKRYREAIKRALQAQKEHGLSAGLVIKCMTQELEEVLEQNI